MILSLLLGLSSAVTSDDPNLKAVLTYSLSVSYPVYVHKCSALMPEKKFEYSSTLKAWSKRNKKQIKAGRKLIRLEGLKTGENTIGITERMADIGWRMIEDKPDDIRKNICLLKLKEMTE